MRTILILLLCLLCAPLVGAQTYITLFEDDFDTDTSANWTLFQDSGTGTPDYTAEFSYDYSADGVPPAPNTTGGTTRGLKLTANNNDSIPDPAAVNVYPNGQSFSGDFRLTVDAYMSFDRGMVGSTEFILAGINHLGTQINWHNSTTSDGRFFAATAEGGAAQDYRSYTGNPSGAPTWNNNDAAAFLLGFPDRNGDGLADDNNIDPALAEIWPATAYEVAGSPFNASSVGASPWVEIEIRQEGGVISWSLAGVTMCSTLETSSFTSGNIMLGYMDIWSSISGDPPAQFGIFDNVKVEQITYGPTPTPTNTPIITGTDTMWKDYR